MEIVNSPSLTNLVLPEGLRGVELKRWLKHQKMSFFHPKKRSKTQFQESIAIHTRLEVSARQKRIQNQANDGNYIRVTDWQDPNRTMIRTK